MRVHRGPNFEINPTSLLVSYMLFQQWWIFASQKVWFLCGFMQMSRCRLHGPLRQQMIELSDEHNSASFYLRHRSAICMQRKCKIPATRDKFFSPWRYFRDLAFRHGQQFLLDDWICNNDLCLPNLCLKFYLFAIYWMVESVTSVHHLQSVLEILFVCNVSGIWNNRHFI